MKKKLLLLLTTIALLLCAACGISSDGSGSLSGEDAIPSASVPEPTVATLAVCGDVMSHMPQTQDAYVSEAGIYDYLPCLQFVKPWISSADFAVANLETTLNGPPYSGYPQFCAPDALAQNLKDIGFDLVTTANNHSMDKGYTGLCRTLDVLDNAGLLHVGSYRTQAEFDRNHGVVVVNVGGISVAFLGYTYGTNGIPVRDANNFSLNRFNIDYQSTCLDPDLNKLSSELAYAKSLKPDLIAVMIHWGVEFQTTENSYQDQIADFLIQNGADLILGSHSHVPQPMMTRMVTMADGTTRSAFVSYSLGNFISNQSPATTGKNYTDVTAILNFELTKDPGTGKTTITHVSYVPLLMLNRGSGVSHRYYLLDVHRAMTEYQAGTNSLITPAVYAKLQYALDGCHKILGPDMDNQESINASPAA